MVDVIDSLVGITPGAPLDAIRARRAIARAQSQESYRVLLEPAEPGPVSPAERFAIAAYAAGLHSESVTAAHYAMELERRAPALAENVAAAIAATRASGPSGAYPPGPLSVEDTAPPGFALPPALATALGPRLAAAFAHVHFLVYHPRDAAPARFQSLLEAGWTTPGIVTLSQLVSFLAYQLRVVAGLRVLAETPA